MIGRLAWSNLRRQPMRLMIAIGGIVFAVVLMITEIGMLLGLARNASLLIDRSSADLWVSVRDVKTIDFVTPMAARTKYLLLSVPGVEQAEEYNISWSVWRLPSGANANCMVIGMDPRSKLAAPLIMAEGQAESLHNQDAIIIDESERAKLANPRIGDYAEILRKRAKLVGFTKGMRSFTTTPYIFTTIKRGKEYGWLGGGIGTENERSVYFLVKAKAGVSAERLRDDINLAFPWVEAHTRNSFSWRTRAYWLIETGVGMGFLVAAFLGLVIGGVIVSQTLYVLTAEKLSEFSVLKAMGASMYELSYAVLKQSVICGGAGTLLGILISLLLSHAAEMAGTPVLIPWPLLLGVTVVTSLLCVLASTASIRKLRQVEPTMVFRA